MTTTISSRVAQSIVDANTPEKVWDLVLSLTGDANGYTAETYLANVQAYAAAAKRISDTSTESLDRAEARAAAAAGLDVYEVRAGIRHIGLYTSYDTAEGMAEFYDATVYDWATGDHA